MATAVVKSFHEEHVKSRWCKRVNEQSESVVNYVDFVNACTKGKKTTIQKQLRKLADKKT